MTGSELSIEIRRLRPTVPIVLMTGFVSAAVTARAKEAGINDVLAKPLVSSDIARSLAMVFGRARLRGAGLAQRAL
jgi:FixJ family two-component response regulator